MEASGDYVLAVVEARNALDLVRTIAKRHGLALDARIETARTDLEAMLEELFPTPPEEDDQEKTH